MIRNLNGPGEFSGFWPLDPVESYGPVDLGVGGNYVTKGQLALALSGYTGVRLEWGSTTVIRLEAYISPYIEVGGEVMDCTLQAECTSTNSLINGEGGETGSAPSASTTYYAYVGNSKCGIAPSYATTSGARYGRPALRLSATAPSNIVDAGFDQITLPYQYSRIPGKYLGATDRARCWRYVGLVRLDGSSQFQSSETQRFVVNYHNRIRKYLFSCPAYNNNNAITSWTTTSTTWAEWNAGTGSRIEFLALGDEAVSYWAGVQAYVGASGKQIGIGEDSTTQPYIIGGEDSQGGSRTVWGIRNSYVPSIGYHYLAALVCSTGGSTMTVEADSSRLGAAADPKASYFGAEIMG